VDVDYVKNRYRKTSDTSQLKKKNTCYICKEEKESKNNNVCLPSLRNWEISQRLRYN